MRDLTDRFMNAIKTSHDKVVEVTALEPGGTTPTVLDIDDGTFNVNPTGARYTASLDISPELGSDLWGLVSTPGARFTIRSGVRYGGNDIDWVECGCYEATTGNHSLTVGEIPLGLTDLTTRESRCRFIQPWVVAAGGSRAAAISAMVLDAVPGATIIVEDDGGDQPAAVFERDRIGARNQIAADGSLDVGWTGSISPTFLIRKQPLINPTSPDWTAVTGSKSNIVNASRDIQLDRLYNTVVVLPVDELQTWSVVTFSVADLSHPRHPSKIGVVPFFYSSPMITTQAQARAAAQTKLQQILGNTEELRLQVLGNPGLEYGDTLAVVHERTDTDPGLAATYLNEGFSFNLISGDQNISSRSTSLAQLEES